MRQRNAFRAKRGNYAFVAMPLPEFDHVVDTYYQDAPCYQDAHQKSQHQSQFDSGESPLFFIAHLSQSPFSDIAPANP
jgi:hypothetical protein